MRPGRRPKLTHLNLLEIDAWMARKPGCTRQRLVPVKVICYRLGIHKRTLYDAYGRTGAYAGIGWAL